MQDLAGEWSQRALPMPLFPEETSCFENPTSSWEELDSIIKKIYLNSNVTSYKKIS
ncbi:MAG: hypothetical protein LBS28_02050 [Streptococcaceae bacterium]|jgi:hypothetical protein|nr:hypothetical protein [Streptococcaceae bacterium]